MKASLTYVMWLPVNEQGDEVDFPDEYWESGEVYNVPAVGDTVVLGGDDWAVAKRVWVNPIAARRATTPCQAVTLHVRREGRS